MPYPLPPLQPWIRSSRYDGWLILAPPFVALAVVALLPAPFRHTAELPLLAWVGVVLLIDVAHVYGTLFQTYFDPVQRQRRSTLLWVAPLACYAGGVALHAAGGLVFWRALAYLAVFHFVRQQYGFMRLYGRQEIPTPGAWLNPVLIYAATLYPLLYWHLAPPRNFNWFVEGDFVQRDWPLGRHLATGLYLALLLAYVGRETWLYYRTRRFNLPRNLLLGGTALSWYAGIVLFNGDLAFTLLNVVAHGVPYLALVWSRRPAAAGGRAATAYPSSWVPSPCLLSSKKASGMGWYGASTTPFSAGFSAYPPWPSPRS